ncbi:hypothetical protein ACLOJK_006508 [Asimina triloba]
MMGNADGGDEPEKKKRQLNSVSSPAMAKTSLSPPRNDSVDAAVLHYQNQKLVQQLDAQKHEMYELEDKFKDLKDKQISYDEMLIAVNRLWNQLVDDLILLGLWAGGYEKGLEAFDATGLIESSDSNGTIKHVEEALASRHLSTVELMKYLEESIDAQRSKTESLSVTLRGELSSEDVLIQLGKVEDSLREEAKNLHRVIDFIHSKHKEYTDEMQKYLDSQSADQSDIKRLSGLEFKFLYCDLEESLAELEESRRKLVNLKVQKEGASGVHVPVLSTANGGNSPDTPADRTMGLRELKDSVEEAKTLAAARLSELEEAREDNFMLSEKLHTLQSELEEDKYVVSSKPYALLSDQLQHLNAELERCKGLIDALQVDRNNTLRREKELSAKVESVDAARSAISEAEVKIEELETKLQKCIMEKNDLEIKLEETEQDAGRKDIKSEFRVMALALSKEMEMMEAQLNRSKQAACEAMSLLEESHSLKVLLDRKIGECKALSDNCAQQMAEIKSLKALMENLQKQKHELQIFLDMYGQECCEKRDLMEIKESERRAQVQAEILKSALDEHSLELRVKAANEAEAACQQRLSAAETEITDLRAKLDASESPNPSSSPATPRRSGAIQDCKIIYDILNLAEHNIFEEYGLENTKQMGYILSVNCQSFQLEKALLLMGTAYLPYEAVFE